MGREAELDSLEKMLAEVRLLTLTGSGGCGKTRLGLELARRVSASRDQGACFVDLAPVSDERAVPSTIAGALGLRDDGRRTLDQIVDHLQDRDTRAGGRQLRAPHRRRGGHRGGAADGVRHT